ncbi:uncharacterized protein LOC141855829 [Brevipalpus obovatus]|uniref:uncharacterized protein LOC141855829 n=1 Tax=Brevipalpus obovatus TaxID=246614 RepID=UPI003D9E0ED7
MNTAQVAQNLASSTSSSSSPPLSSTTLNTSSDHNGKKADGSDNFSSSQEASNSQDANKSSSSSTVTLPSSKEPSSSSPAKSLSKEKLCEKSSSQKSIQGTSSAFSSMGNLSEKELLSSNGSECPHLVNPNYHYSRSHQRRFHRRFPAVDPQEKVIEWYNCALVEDILIQGYLYISENYFAFYSNLIFYKTQLLIPICDVISVTREKTARIFPTAVGICTEQAKYVFGSLMSRETTFGLMQEVWRRTLIQMVPFPYLPTVNIDQIIKAEPIGASEKTEIAETSCIEENGESFKTITSQSPPIIYPQPFCHPNIVSASEPISLLSSEINPIPPIFASHDTDSSGSESETNRESKSGKNFLDKLPSFRFGWLKSIIGSYHLSPRKPLSYLWSRASCTSLLLLFVTLLLVVLFISSFVFLYRVDQVHSKLISLFQLDDVMEQYQVHAKRATLRDEVTRLISLLDEKAADLNNMKERVEELLHLSNEYQSCSR